MASGSEPCRRAVQRTIRDCSAPSRVIRRPESGRWLDRIRCSPLVERRAGNNPGHTKHRRSSPTVWMISRIVWSRGTDRRTGDIQRYLPFLPYLPAPGICVHRHVDAAVTELHHLPRVRAFTDQQGRAGVPKVVRCEAVEVGFAGSGEPGVPSEVRRSQRRP
jgi:hypothetical protein